MQVAGDVYISVCAMVAGNAADSRRELFQTFFNDTKSSWKEVVVVRSPEWYSLLRRGETLHHERVKPCTFFSFFLNLWEGLVKISLYKQIILIIAVSTSQPLLSLFHCAKMRLEGQRYPHFHTLNQWSNRNWCLAYDGYVAWRFSPWEFQLSSCCYATKVNSALHLKKEDTEVQILL